jgi:hypothetical protein
MALSENRHEFDVTLGTFGHPRYGIMATGDVYDGEEDRLVCGRSYFDALTILGQLGIA